MSKLISENFVSNGSYCPAMFAYICWPQTPANHSVNVSCTVVRHQGVDTARLYKDFV
jgi:hypothetical protein